MLHHDGTPARVLLVDNHQVVCMGLPALFEGTPTIEVVGEASSIAEAAPLSRTAQPDVVLLDLRLPDGHGVEGCREIKAISPNSRILLFSSYVADEAVSRISYAAVFMDCQMPEMDGYAATASHHSHDSQRDAGRPRGLSGSWHGRLC